jgi:alkanesulfonate monooxygenase SsuD/methylene tetrahydromethanopterin reductase-like flavin-dependent oxidoreductase (luciferase family)
VTGVTFRPPALLAKAITTLDVLTGGRAWLGIGAGYHGDEAREMGLPLPPAPERYERLIETLEIASRMWVGDESPFEGAHYRLDRPVDRPGPLHRPRPPILIGGHGERRTLRLVARYADACNLFDIPDGGQTVRRKLAVLAQHCREVGRPYEAIEKTLSTRLGDGESAAELAGRCSVAASWGIEHLVLGRSRAWTVEAVHIVGDAIARLGAAGSSQDRPPPALR